jgi:hypothetical protein
MDSMMNGMSGTMMMGMGLIWLLLLVVLLLAAAALIKYLFFSGKGGER